MNKKKLSNIFEKIFFEVQNQDQSFKENYQDISRRMEKMRKDMNKRREQFRLIRNK